MATSEDQINTTQLTQLMILNLGSRNACMRALIAHPTDLNAAANWLINHRTDANIDQNPFQQQAAATTTTTTTMTTNYNPYTPNITQQPQQHTQQHMVQQVMNLGYTRDEALRAYTNVSTTDRNDTNKLVEYLVKNPKKDDKKTYNTYSNTNSSYYPYQNSNKKKVYRPVINIDDIEVDKEEILDLEESEALEHIGIILREYKKWIENNYENKNGDNHVLEKDKDYEKNGFYAYFLTVISGDGEYTLSDVMDDFIQLLTKHDVRYGEYDKVYKKILDEEAMNGKLDGKVDAFDLVKRLRFSHDLKEDEMEKAYFGFKSVKEITIQQLCDKMYCYLVNSYDIAAKLAMDEYEKLDTKNGMKTMAELEREQAIELKENDKERDISNLIKQKDISSYIGNKHYMEYAQLLEDHRKNWFNSCTNDVKHAKFNKFYMSFTMKGLETRIDPKELKAKLAKEKREKLREKKRKEKEEADRLKAEQQKKEEQEAKDKPKEVEKEKDDKEQDKEKESDKAEDDKDKPKEQEQEEKPKEVEVNDDSKKDQEKDTETETEKDKTKEEAPKKSTEEAISGLEDDNAPKTKPAAKATVLPPTKPAEPVDKKEFSYGVRYNYWAADMEDLIAITIDKEQAKYKDLKDELVNNTVCKISEFEYNLLNEKAQIYIDTEYCQENIEAGVNTFGIDILAKITKDHLIALMLYCNYDAMRNALCSTFIRDPFDETNESMIERHSHFYYFGKLLRESIECYGVEAHRSETKVFYHGISSNKQIMNDDEIKALFIYTPLSTTSSMEIALNNNTKQDDDEKDSNSLILQLKGYVCKYFDCAWISDSCYEQEKIFFGGTRSLSVSKCIDYKYGYDHKLFINSIKYIPNIFEAPISEWKINKNDDMLQETKEMIRNLIFHQLNKFGDNLKNNKYPDNLGINGIPKEIEDELNTFCTKKSEIRMHYDAMYNHRAYSFLSSLFMTLTRTCAKLEILDELFPNITTFSMIRVPLTTLTFMYLKSYISPPKPPNEEEGKDDHKENAEDTDKTKKPQPCRCKVREIRLIDPKTAAMSIEQVIMAERQSLADMQWTIDSPDQVSLVLKYSETPVIIKEPTPPPVVEEKKEEKPAEEKKPVKKRPMKRRKKRPPQKKQPGAAAAAASPKATGDAASTQPTKKQEEAPKEAPKKDDAATTEATGTTTTEPKQQQQ